jgi:PhzF family phenazine biosynthesis protein
MNAPATVTPARRRPFQQLDVFTAEPYFGNPLGVVLDGSGLSTQQMQRYTDWSNLSECTFLLPPTQPGADYRVRIFCPGRELPFAGHPTLGSCQAWLNAGGRPQGEFVVQECGVGLVRLKRGPGPTRLAFAAPPLRRSGPLDAEELARITAGLGLTPADIVASAWCDNGPPWRAVLLRSAEQVLALQPDRLLLNGLDIGVVGPHAVGADVAFEVRAFFTTATGVSEDPVTGSLNAALAQWLMGTGLAPSSYVAAQGTVLGRAGRVHLQRDGTDIWVGGDSVLCIEGSVLL